MTTFRENSSKNLHVMIKVETKKKNLAVTIEKEAQLKTDEFTFAAVETFNKDIALINKILKNAIKNNSFVTFDILTAHYELGERAGDLRRVDGGWWRYQGYPLDDGADECGFYLTPKGNTPVNHDMVYDFTLTSITA